MTTLDIKTPGLVVNLKGVIVDINSAALEIFHYLKTDLLGKHINLLMPDNVREKHSIGFEDFMKRPMTKSKCLRVNGVTKEKDLLYLTIYVDKTESGAMAVISNSTLKEGIEQRLLQKLG